METKKVTLELNGKRLTLTIRGEKKLLDQLSQKPKRIRLFCERAELKAITSYLLEHLQAIFEGHEFLVDDSIFVKDEAKKSFLFLKNNTYCLILNNRELKIPLKIYNTAQSSDDFFASCNAIAYPRPQWFELE